MLEKAVFVSEKPNLESDVPAEPDVAGHGQVVELEQVGHTLEALQELVHLVEGVPQLDQRRGGEGALLRQSQIAYTEFNQFDFFKIFIFN